VEDFKNLKVWTKAHELTLAIYQQTRTFPRDEIYGLTGQIRRASASIGANIAEDAAGDLEPKILEIQRMLASLAQRLQDSILARSQELAAGS